MRYIGLMFDGWIGPDYEKGLARLKAIAETPPPRRAGADDLQRRHGRQSMSTCPGRAATRASQARMPG